MNAGERVRVLTSAKSITVIISYAYEKTYVGTAKLFTVWQVVALRKNLQTIMFTNSDLYVYARVFRRPVRTNFRSPSRRKSTPTPIAYSPSPETRQVGLFCIHRDVYCLDTPWITYCVLKFTNEIWLIRLFQFSFLLRIRWVFCCFCAFWTTN